MGTLAQAAREGQIKAPSIWKWRGVMQSQRLLMERPQAALAMMTPEKVKRAAEL